MKFVCKAFCFSLIFICFFLVLDSFFYDKRDTSPVWEMIQNPENNELDILFIGSSHAYVDINPLIINEALDIRTAVLSSSYKPIDLAYADLKTILHYTRPKSIVLEAHSITKSAKELCETGREGFIYTDIDAIRNPFYRASMIMEVLDRDYWLEAFSPLFRPMLTWKRINNIIQPLKSYGNKKYGAIFGYEPRSGIYWAGVKAQVRLDEIEQTNLAKSGLQLDENTIEQRYAAGFSYLHKFLQLTDQQDIPVYIVKSPVAMPGYVELMKEIEIVSRQHRSVKGVYNYNTKLTAIGLTTEDFYDSDHLNQVGSGKFTMFLTDRIGARLNINPDYSKVCYYKDEFVEQLPNGLYRYRVETFPNSLLRFVIKDQKVKTIKETPYGKKNYIDMQRIRYNNSLCFNIKPEKQYANTVSPEERDFRFMKDKGVLQRYSRHSLNIKQQGKIIVVENHFKEVPVLNRFILYYNGQIIKEQLYSNNDTFKYKLTKPGKYEIRVQAKTKGKQQDLKTVRVSPILFDGSKFELPEIQFSGVGGVL